MVSARVGRMPLMTEGTTGSVMSCVMPGILLRLLMVSKAWTAPTGIMKRSAMAAKASHTSQKRMVLSQARSLDPGPPSPRLLTPFMNKSQAKMLLF